VLDRWSIRRAGPAGVAAAVLGTLLTATLVTFALEEWAGLDDASSVYLLAVSAAAYLGGSGAGIATALGSFAAYNFLFVPPRFTFQVADPQHLLNLVVLLAIGVSIGRLAGSLRDQARSAAASEREARSLFAVSRELAVAKRVDDALPQVLARLVADCRLSRAWVGLGQSPTVERVAADSDAGSPLPELGPHRLLRRGSGDQAPEWVRLSPPVPAPQSRAARQPQYRIGLGEEREPIGSLWAERPAALAEPSTEESRLLAAAADQIGQAILRDRLAEQATEVEVARRSEALKTALLDSVSHDLRTPLAAIRTTAGSLAEATDPADGGRLAMAREIDAEAERLARVVGELLDMSRIESGALHSNLEPVPLPELVEAVVERAAPVLERRAVRVEIPAEIAPVRADEVLLGQVLANLVENAAVHTPSEAPILIRASQDGETLRIVVEDGGPGVSPDQLVRLFEKFYRVPGRRQPARRGSGLGLAIVKGMVQAMGGSVVASASRLGGLAIEVRLPAWTGIPG
jgi:two-component system sensor histidine kinase KdpD